MEPWQAWAIAWVIKPFALFLLFVAVVIPLKIVILRFIPEGRLRRILLFKWHVH